MHRTFYHSGASSAACRSAPRPVIHASGLRARSLLSACNNSSLLAIRLNPPHRCVAATDRYSCVSQISWSRRYASQSSPSPPQSSTSSATSHADTSASSQQSPASNTTRFQPHQAMTSKQATSAFDSLRALYHRIFPNSNAALTSHYSPSSPITSSSSPPKPDHSASPADLSAHHSPAAATATTTSSGTPTSTLHTLSIESQNKTLRYAFIGNITIATLKLAVFLLTSSQAMFAEFIHTFIDTVNQGLLLIGAQQAAKLPDHRHQMGYGRAPYFFSLISALNLFWFGVVFNTYHTFMYAGNDVQLHWYTWAVLGVSLLIDGTVLRVSLKELVRHKPANRSTWKHWKQLKNPLVIGTIMEDVAAVLGVGLAAMGIGLSHLTGNIVFDHIASLSISGLLLYTSYALIRTNYRYLLGFSLSPTVQHNITTMIKSRRSVQCVYSVRGEWTSSDSFAFRCQLDFDVRAQSTFTAAATVSAASTSTSRMPLLLMLNCSVCSCTFDVLGCVFFCPTGGCVRFRVSHCCAGRWC